MKIQELVRKFEEQDIKDTAFNLMLFLVADYTMYEQAIIKKDNISARESTIKYRYSKNSYRYVNEFFSKIQFLSKPIIGKGKTPVIKDLPDKHKFPMKHEVPFEEKIYILDKIKDSFMHLHGDDTLYDFDMSDHTIVIRNVGGDFSLECKIPVDELFKFNQRIKLEYDKSTPNLDWVNEFLSKSRNLKTMRNVMAHRIYGSDLYQIRISHNRRAIIDENNNVIFLEKSLDGVKSMSVKDLVSYHANSYVTLLMASSSDKNYPLLSGLNNFDYHCENPSYVEMISSITRRMNDFGFNLLRDMEHMSPENIKGKILDFLFSINKQNKKEEGLICDLAKVNGEVIKRLRNARSHANNRGTDKASFGEENILFYDVSYNSLLNTASEKAEPTFAFQGKKKDFDNLFSEIRTCSMSNAELKEKIENELVLGKSDTLEMLLDEIDRFIIQAAVDGSLYADSLSLPVGNARDFTDFIRKALNGTFVKDDYKKFVKVG